MLITDQNNEIEQKKSQQMQASIYADKFPVICIYFTK
jgi:hypothetical protein